MEESILENSKGATYMSFILDVEIVIKKEGTRVNLAENKIRKQASKKEDEEAKQIKQGAGPPRKQKEDTVYSVTVEPTNIFNAKSKHKEEDTSLVPLEKDPPEQTQNIPDREISDDDKVQKLNEKLENLEEAHQAEGRNIIPHKKITKKRKISKTDRKSKAFKGKVEAIDFLECNRIFLCNPVQIPNYTFHGDNNFNSNLDDITRLTAAGETEDSLHKIAYSNNSQSDHGDHVKSSVSYKKYKFWKRSKPKRSTIPLPDLFCENTYSSGDCNKKETLEFYGTFLETNSIKENEESTNYLINCQHNLMVFDLYKHFINSLDKESDSNIESVISESYTSVDKESFRKLFCKGKMLEIKAAKKSISLPNLIFNQKNINTRMKNYFEGFNLDVGEDLLKKRISDDLDNINTEKAWKGLSNLEIRFSSDTDELVSPKIQITNVETKLKRISGHSTKETLINELSETKSRSVIQNTKKNSIVDGLRTRSLGNINKLYVENIFDTGFAIFLEYLNYKRKRQLQYKNKAQTDKFPKRRRFRQIVRNLSCLSSTSKEKN